MTLPISAQSTANFVQSWNDFQIAIQNGSSWCAKCIDLSNSLIENQNFSTILSDEQQKWVQECLAFFNTLPLGLPPQP